MKVYTWYPIRCSSCNKHVGHLAMDIRARLESGDTLENMYANDYDSLRVCCKTALMNPCAYNLGAQDRRAVYESAVDGTLPPAEEERAEGQGRVMLVESRRYPGVYIGERTDEPAAMYRAGEREEVLDDLNDGDAAEQLLELPGALAEREGVHAPRVPGVPAVSLMGDNRYEIVDRNTRVTGLLGRAYLAV